MRLINLVTCHLCSVPHPHYLTHYCPIYISPVISVLVSPLSLSSKSCAAFLLVNPTSYSIHRSWSCLGQFDSLATRATWAGGASSTASPTAAPAAGGAASAASIRHRLAGLFAIKGTLLPIRSMCLCNSENCWSASAQASATSWRKWDTSLATSLPSWSFSLNWRRYSSILPSFPRQTL